MKLDIAVSRRGAVATHPHLVAGFSLKWSFRTDRVQDPRIQGSKMASLRRGRMPHFAVVTMEPRPSMLAILGEGSGDVDFVYHLALPELTTAINTLAALPRHGPSWLTAATFRHLVSNRRVLDYHKLVEYVSTL